VYLLRHATRDSDSDSTVTHSTVTLLNDARGADRSEFLNQRYSTSVLVNMVSIMERMVRLGMTQDHSEGFTLWCHTTFPYVCRTSKSCLPCPDSWDALGTPAPTSWETSRSRELWCRHWPPLLAGFLVSCWGKSAAFVYVRVSWPVAITDQLPVGQHAVCLPDGPLFIHFACLECRAVPTCSLVGSRTVPAPCQLVMGTLTSF
jgi:hypothetical protein